MNNWELASTMTVAVGIVVTATPRPKGTLVVAAIFAVCALAHPVHRHLGHHRRDTAATPAVAKMIRLGLPTGHAGVAPVSVAAPAAPPPATLFVWAAGATQAVVVQAPTEAHRTPPPIAAD